MTLLLVALGAALGAPLRYLTDRAVQSKHDSVFPWGTMAVNIAGSFVLGLLTALPADAELTALFGTGFCGALTTYSTFSYETLKLAQTKNRFHALANVVASVVAGLGAAAVGIILGVAITGSR
jgi:fluoride exporter